MNMGPVPCCICSKVSPKKQCLWNTMIEDKAFCKSKDGSFGWSIVCREGKSVSRVSVSSNNNSTASSMMEAVQCNHLPPGGLLITPRHPEACEVGQWQIGHSGESKGRSALVTGSPYCWARDDLHSCHAHCFPEPRVGVGQLEKEINSACQFVYFCCFLNLSTVAFTCYLSSSFSLFFTLYSFSGSRISRDTCVRSRMSEGKNGRLGKEIIKVIEDRLFEGQ